MKSLKEEAHSKIGSCEAAEIQRIVAPPGDEYYLDFFEMLFQNTDPDKTTDLNWCQCNVTKIINKKVRYVQNE